MNEPPQSATVCCVPVIICPFKGRWNAWLDKSKSCVTSYVHALCMFLVSQHCMLSV